MRSMTGFGHASGEAGGHRCSIELRSVNHRFLDLKLRLPPPWTDPVIEQLIHQALRRRVERGSVILTLRLDGALAAEPAVRVDTALGQAYGRALRELLEALHLFPSLHGAEQPLPSAEAALHFLGLVAAQPGVLLTGESAADPVARFGEIEPLLEQAVADLLRSRQREGAALGADLRVRLLALGGFVDDVARIAGDAPEQHRRRLQERLARLTDGGVALDQQRLAQEVALLADRLDISEEVIRLRTHLGEFERLCQGDALVGRRLDFLTQELNREMNTVGAKAQSAEVAARVVAMKAELERLREQIQNVE